MRLNLLLTAIVLAGCGNQSETWETKFKSECIERIESVLVSPASMDIVEIDLLTFDGTFDDCFGPDVGSGGFGVFPSRLTCVISKYTDKDETATPQKIYMATVKVDSANRFNAIIRSEFSCYLLDDTTTTEPSDYFDLIVERS